MKHEYFAIYKPYGYLSQFTKEVPTHSTLGDLYDFPKTVYPVGRLDKDSEGLLLLTDDKALTDRLLHPKFRHRRIYYVQVEGVPDEAALQKIRSGVAIRINKKIYHTRPAKVAIIQPPPTLPERDPPIRFRANIPTTWLRLTLTEGKNRQVRRMCAKVGFPVLRLVRWSIEDLHLEAMPIGAVKPIEREELFRLLGIVR
ncbi:MAG: pseudouridine synthase [Bacteroidota bacterium]